MNSIFNTNIPKNNVVGNNYQSDSSLGFKEEVKSVFEAYSGAGVNLSTDFLSITSSPEAREEFVANVLESLSSSPVFTNAACADRPFYNNYSERAAQLLENSLHSVATESAVLGYAPIVAYNPFFLKKQWISTVYNDVLMTEVPQSTVINLGFEKRYIKKGTEEYEIPDVFYDDEKMAELTKAATGLRIKETPIALTAFKPALSMLTSTYVDGLINGDVTAELTSDIHVSAVVFTDTAATTHTIPCNIRVDITTHNFVKGDVKCDVKDTDGAITETLTDKLLGSVDFKTGKVTLMGTTGKVTSVVISGTLANRFNQNSLSVERRVENLQYVMPESGPRMNTAVTVEDAADAMILQKVDMIADNVDMMGNSLANFEDFECRSFLKNSFDAQKKAGAGPHGYKSMIVEGGFNALPYEQYTRNISDWMTDSREYFERIIEALKDILKCEECAVVVVANPKLVRFLNDGIKWVFSGDTQLSGMKLDYSFGVFTTSQDKVHIITTRYLSEDEGLQFLLIPLTDQLITYKHYKFNVVIDRGYRNPVYTLTPNIMCTHRTLTFEVLPVQGKMEIGGRDLFSPDTLRRA